MYNTARILMQTGCRFTELYAENWKQVDSNTYLLYTPKTKNYRVMQKQCLTSEFIDYINTLDNSLFVLSKSSFSYNWKVLRQPVYFTDKEKNIATHIFRYFYIRNRLNQGFEPEEIQQDINHANLKQTISYLNNNIYINEIKI